MPKLLCNAAYPLKFINEAAVIELEDMIRDYIISSASMSSVPAYQHHTIPVGSPECSTDALHIRPVAKVIEVGNLNLDVFCVIEHHNFCKQMCVSTQISLKTLKNICNAHNRL